MASISDWALAHKDVEVNKICSLTYWELEPSGFRIYDANKQMIFSELKSNIDE